MTREAPQFSGLRFAVYARKSTEGAHHEDHRSTARQVEQAKACVERKDGQVVPEHVYVDEDTYPGPSSRPAVACSRATSLAPARP